MASVVAAEGPYLKDGEARFQAHKEPAACLKSYLPLT